MFLQVGCTGVESEAIVKPDAQVLVRHEPGEGCIQGVEQDVQCATSEGHGLEIGYVRF